MIVSENYKNAFMEVYAIINTLVYEDYKKIPKEIISIIEENKNDDYEFFLNDEISLQEQPMMDETKAILLNLYRDYLASPEQSEKLKKIQAKERQQDELEKQQNYSSDVFNNNLKYKSDDNQVVEDDAKCNGVGNAQKSLIKAKHEKWYDKVINFIKVLFKR